MKLYVYEPDSMVVVAVIEGESIVVTTDEAFALGLREVEFECNPPR